MPRSGTAHCFQGSWGPKNAPQMGGLQPREGGNQPERLRGPVGTEERGSWCENGAPTGLGMLLLTPRLPATPGATHRETGVRHRFAQGVPEERDRHLSLLSPNGAVSPDSRWQGDCIFTTEDRPGTSSGLESAGKPGTGVDPGHLRCSRGHLARCGP